MIIEKIQKFIDRLKKKLDFPGRQMGLCGLVICKSEGEPYEKKHAASCIYRDLFFGDPLLCPQSWRQERGDRSYHGGRPACELREH